MVAAIIVKDNRIFATQCGYGDFKDGWEFPGGKIEPGESQEAALKREIEEELGAEISIDKWLKTIDYDYPKFHLRMHCYICHFQSSTFTLLEHEAAKELSLNYFPILIDKIN